MNLGAHCHNSSRFAVNFLHKRSKKGLSLKAVTIWCMATSGLRPLILRATLLSISISNLNNSICSCIMLITNMDIRWCCLLVTICSPNLVTSVSNKSMESSGSCVNQLGVAPFSDVRKTWQSITSSEVYKLTYVTYISICSFGSMVPSYLSSVGVFHSAGWGTSNIPSMNGCRHIILPQVSLDVDNRRLKWMWLSTLVRGVV